MRAEVLRKVDTWLLAKMQPEVYIELHGKSGLQPILY